ncbi:hypothetical protein C0585_03505 [Candidatus Woesearchaeota archaeon]|nr:MAG: hypothetical protein C0585_03505 [Candidatus Woesearchaeota archaeon]
MRLYLVRHVETESNEKKILQGFEDSPISEKGLKQLEKLSRRLKEENIDVCYTSDLLRAKKTAEGIMEFHKCISIKISEDVREINLGEFSGKKVGSLKEAADKLNIPLFDFQPEGGERLKDFVERIRNFYHYLLENYPNKSILVVTHGGVIVHLLIEILGYEHTFENVKKFIAKNASLTIIEIQNKKVNVILDRSTKHLG